MAKKRVVHDAESGRDVEQFIIEEKDGFKDYSEIKKNRRFIVDEIFDVGEIHVIAGPSGSGKTTWLLQSIKDWQNGQDILGHKSNPQKFLYLSCDRSTSQLGLTLERMKLDDWANLCAFSIAELEIKFNIEHDKLKLEDLPKLFPWCKVFFIEAMGWFMPEGKNSGYNDLLKFWSKVKVMVEQNNITIVGTTHCPKAKPKDRYANPRDRIMGSVAQAGVASTIIVFEYGDELDVQDDTRIITVCPRNAKNQVLEYNLDNAGRLIFNKYVKVKDKEDSEKITKLDQLFIMDAHKKGDHLAADYFYELKHRADVSRATMYRQIKRWEGKGWILRVGRDFYLVEIHLPNVPEKPS